MERMIFLFKFLSNITPSRILSPRKMTIVNNVFLIFTVFLNVLGCFLIPYLICLIVAGVPVLVMEIGLGQYTSQGGITAWKICPIFQGKKSSKPHSSSGILIYVLSLSTLARHEMSRSCKTHQFKEITYKAVPSGATSRFVDPENFRRSSSLSFRFDLLYSYTT